MNEKLSIPSGKKAYFASDCHFGLNIYESPIECQKRFCAWMDGIKADCGALFLLGDMLDYWFEYRTVVPKGFVRYFAKLAEFTDAGIPVFVFYGNHDMWMTGYLADECGCTIIPDAWEGDILGRRFHLEHGDANGDKNFGFKLMRKFFRCKAAQWCFRWIHPDLTMWFGYLWSEFNRKRRIPKGKDGKRKFDAAKRSFDPKCTFRGEENEQQIVWAKRHYEQHPEIDFYVFGHRHIDVMVDLHHPNGTNAAKLAILGSWIYKDCYAVFDGNEFMLVDC